MYCYSVLTPKVEWETVLIHIHTGSQTMNKLEGRKHVTKVILKIKNAKKDGTLHDKLPF